MEEQEDFCINSEIRRPNVRGSVLRLGAVGNIVYINGLTFFFTTTGFLAGKLNSSTYMIIIMKKGMSRFLKHDPGSGLLVLLRRSGFGGLLDLSLVNVQSFKVVFTVWFSSLTCNLSTCEAFQQKHEIHVPWILVFVLYVELCGSIVI